MMKYSSWEEFIAAAKNILPAGPVEVRVCSFLTNDDIAMVYGSPCVYVGQGVWEALQKLPKASAT